MIWDGKDECKHEWGNELKVIGNEYRNHLNPKKFWPSSIKISEKNNASSGCFCLYCSAWRGQLGLEPTPDLYVKHLVEIFREVRRVLRKDGIMFLILGDTYYRSGRGTNDYRTGASRSINKSDVMFTKHPPQKKKIAGLKPKDLVGIPWTVAFALRDDGWYLRSEIIWHKPNASPENVKDRPTRAHEQIFLLTKNKNYYFDQEAVKEKSVHPESFSGIRPRDPSKMAFLDPQHYRFRGNIGKDGKLGFSGRVYPLRNIRTVWTFGTQSHREAHFATFPEKLVEPMIKAGTSEQGCCPKCGSNWVRILRGRPAITLGWQPTCECLPHEPIPCTVLDPFAGSGTVLRVAKMLNRNFIGIDLGYQELQKKRIKIQKKLKAI